MRLRVASVRAGGSISTLGNYPKKRGLFRAMICLLARVLRHSCADLNNAIFYARKRPNGVMYSATLFDALSHFVRTLPPPVFVTNSARLYAYYTASGVE